MQAQKFSVSHQYKSRSLVIQEALELLRQRELETAYQQASLEVDPDWDVTIQYFSVKGKWVCGERRRKTDLPANPLTFSPALSKG